MRRKVLTIAVAAMVMAAVGVGAAYRMLYGSCIDRELTLDLLPEENYEQMRDKIHAVIDHDAAFDFYADRISLGSTIKPGRYTLRKGMNVIEVARLLKIGSHRTVRLTLNNARTPEALAGKIARRIDADSAAVLGALRDKNLAAELGFSSPETMFSIFLPETYEVYADISPSDLVRRMKRESDKFWADERRRQAAEREGLTPLEVMTLASIVHEETNRADEMPRIAGVYLNRLHKGMLLQADPTVKYALGDFSIKRVLLKHLQVDSPYNTYIYIGLPPSPIAMPDMAAIEAVLGCEHHDFYYFCARAELDGYHNFARTLAEHNRNAAAYHRALERLNVR